MLKSGQFDVNIYPLNKEVLKLIQPQDVNSWRSHKSPWEANFEFHREASDLAVGNEKMFEQGDDKESLVLIMTMSGKNDKEGSFSLVLCFPQSAHHCVVSDFFRMSDFYYLLFSSEGLTGFDAQDRTAPLGFTLLRKFVWISITGDHWSNQDLSHAVSA